MSFGNIRQTSDMNSASAIRRNMPNIVVAVVTIAFLGATMYAHVRSTRAISRIADDLLNSLHGPGFVIVSLFIFSVLRLYHRRPANYLHAGIVAMGIGLLSELVQVPGQRDASVSDLVLDTIGIVAGLSTLALFDREFRSRIAGKTMAGLVVTSVVSLSLAFVPTAWYAYAAIAQYRALPTLLAFEDAWEREAYRDTLRNLPELVPAAPGWPEGSNTIAYVKESGRSGVLVSIDPYRDWTNYSSLSFVAASPTEDFQHIALSIREIRRNGEERGIMYQERLRIGPEPTRYVIPLENIRSAVTKRSFDVTRVKSVALLAATPYSSTELFLDDIRLE